MLLVPVRVSVSAQIWSRDSLAAYAGIFVLLRVAHSIQLSYPEKVPLIVR